MTWVRELLRSTRARVLLAVVLVVGAIGSVGFGDAGSTHLVAYFASTDGIYAGDEVRVLGVPVGKIDEITPEQGRVRVELHIDGDVQVPADAHAVIVAPSLVSSRYIQLTPRFDGGPTMADGATIPLSRTAVPVEWDAIKDQVDQLSVALGPQGANRNGALSHLVDAASGALDGEGGTLNQTIADLAGTIRVLDSGSDDAFSVVRNLQLFVTALSQSDTQIAEFTQRIDSVSQVLKGDRRLVGAALDDLAKAVGDVEDFVRAHRGRVGTLLTRLTDVVGVVAHQQGDLAQILHLAPNALENLTESYHQRQNAVAVDLHGANIHSPGQLVCGAIGGAAATDESGTEALCNRLIGNLLDRVANNPQSQQLLSALLVLLGGM
ncbi:MAG TPA: MCE family protein [Nocardioides sp.]|nr:MCE family protein [Nocardioides sp.]